MNAENLDPATQAQTIWSDTLALIKQNSRLTAREQGWLAGVTAEAVVGTTIILDVENAQTLQVLQTELNEPIIGALEIANGGSPMFPAFKVMPPAQPEPQTTASPEDSGSRAADAQGAAKESVQPDEDSRTPRHSAEQTGDSRPAAAQEREDSAVHMARPDEQTAESHREPEHEPAQQPVTSHYDEAIVQTFEDIDPVAGFGPSVAGTTAPQYPPQSEMQGSFTPGVTGNYRDPVTHLNSNDTFDTFIQGDSNRFARTVALAVAEGSGRDYNPLCIYGGSGLGKTHLLHAIGNYAVQNQKPRPRVLYVTSEEFTNDFIESIRTSGQDNEDPAMEKFYRKYREVDVLLIDDIQFLGGKRGILEQFFPTFNSLYQANKRIVIASDVPPHNLEDFEDRLISRFEQGITVDVKPPNLETRIAILRMLAEQNHIRVPNDVLNLIAERFANNVRELEGALKRVIAMASLNHQPVTRALTERTLQDFFTTDVEVKPTDIIARVAKYFHLTFDDIVGPGRPRSVTLARQIAMYLTRDMTSMSLMNIGQIFGGRDHTTVMHACKHIADKMQEKQEIYNYVNELTVELKQHLND